MWTIIGNLLTQNQYFNSSARLTARSVCHHGRTEFFIPRIQIYRMHRISRTSRTFCIPVFLVIPPLIMCISCPFVQNCYWGVLQKPIVSLLALPQKGQNNAVDKIPVLQLPQSYKPTPDPRANLKRYTGLIVDRIIGSVWWLLTVVGAGSAVIGIFNFVVGLGAWRWLRTAHAPWIARENWFAKVVIFRY